MTPPNRTRLALVLFLLPFLATGAESLPEDGWVSLFNGHDLAGWTVKIAGHEPGENFGDTFRVENGEIRADYKRYESFDMQFGHLFTDIAYAHYILRLEYKLTGDRMEDAPRWTERNSGVMLHAQSPQSMGIGQHFPVSLEGQFLARSGPEERPTGNVCTPGTHIEVNGELTTAHIVESTSSTFPLDEWVRFEAEVRGHEEIIYRINGEEVLRYQHPQLDAEDPDARRLIEAGADRKVSFGHIALQAEGHPVSFRRIELKPLPQ